ncbi:MAG TPA: OmpA family protein [Patescibacteria group bacterium]|nr:OmpA family protein [Patescibacteria group bacterium]
MYEAITERHRRPGRSRLAAGSLLLSVVLLSGCSSVPDYASPVHWYKSTSDWISGAPDTPDASAKDAPAEAGYPKLSDESRPQIGTNKDRTDVSKGLSADRANAKYTQDSVNREGNPTRPLNPDAVVAAKSTNPVQHADAADAPPAPAKTLPPTPSGDIENLPVDPVKPQVTTDDAPPPPAAPAQQVAAAAPAPVAAAAPAPVAAAAPAPVAAVAPVLHPPVAARPTGPESVEDAYRRRLAEFSSGTVSPAVPMTASATSSAYSSPVASAAPQLTRPGSTSVVMGGEEVVHLVPPSHNKAHSSRAPQGTRSLADYNDTGSAASFEVATLAFGEGTSDLSAAERVRLKDVAALYRQSGGNVRVFGRSSSPRLDTDPTGNQEANRSLALERADTVAAELVRLGVPARKIYSGAASDAQQPELSVSASAGESAEIYIDY